MTTALSLDGVPFTWGDISAGAVVILIVLLILTGRLVPKTTHVRELSDKDTQIMYLRQALDTNREIMRELADQNGDLQDAARTSVAVGEAIQRLTGGGGAG